MPLSRRDFTGQVLRASALALAAQGSLQPIRTRAQSPSPTPSPLPHLSSARPRLEHGVASGDVALDSAVVWSRTDRPARMIVEWSTHDSFREIRTITGGIADASTDFTAKTVLTGLPSGARIHYRVRFEGRGGPDELSTAVQGKLVTASRDPQDVHFAWSGDTCGQGWGIDPTRGGCLTYQSIRQLEPQFMVHSGDLIYADNPIVETVPLPDGTTWRNLVTEEKSKVAETLREFRGNYRYNLLDSHIRDCQAAVPLFAQWDDHEVRNNWYPGQKLLEDPRYHEKDLDTLVTRARQAFLEYAPVRPSPDSRIYRSVPRGPLCELFFLDLRSCRGPNSANRQPEPGPDTAFLGDSQLAWLERALISSRARWKIICSDMPLGLLIADGSDRWEALANGDHGAPLGREHEIARLLRILRRQHVRNLLWLTADVHYAAAHHYDPARAAFTEFDPFWEFVSGPLHAGTFGPAGFDRTFGPELRWSARPPGAPQNLPPSADEQFFGTVRIAAATGIATVTQHNRLGRALWSIDLPPTPSA